MGDEDVEDEVVELLVDLSGWEGVEVGFGEEHEALRVEDKHVVEHYNLDELVVGIFIY